MLQKWQEAGLLFPSAVMRGLFTLDRAYVTRRLGRVSSSDLLKLEQALRLWFGLSGLDSDAALTPSVIEGISRT